MQLLAQLGRGLFCLLLGFGHDLLGGDHDLLDGSDLGSDLFCRLLHPYYLLTRRTGLLSPACLCVHTLSMTCTRGIRMSHMDYIVLCFTNSRYLVGGIPSAGVMGCLYSVECREGVFSETGHVALNRTDPNE